MIPDPMNPIRASALLAAAGLAWTSLAEPPPPIGRLRLEGQEVVLEIPRPPRTPVAGTEYRFRYETSPDLRSWTGEKSLGVDAAGVPRDTVVHAARTGFFRIHSEVVPGGSTEGADRLGYNAVFRQELSGIGQITVAEFLKRQGGKPYLGGISFDPTTAKYWDLFNADPAVVNASVPAGGDRRLHDFRLNPEEFARFRTNGFVVSERLGSHSFADVYYRIFTDDLPVFITTDSLLHAWHYSFQKMLEELEQTQLAPTLERLLDTLDSRLVVAMDSEWSRTDPSVQDVDLYLSVARSLLKGRPVPPRFADSRPADEILTRISAGQFEEGVVLWGRKRPVDFSQFIPRGHYTGSATMKGYFQAQQWLALAEFQVLSLENPAAAAREFRSAFLLLALARAEWLGSGSGSAWTPYDAVQSLLDSLMGPPNAMTLRDLDGLITRPGPSETGRLTSLGLIEPPPSSEVLDRIQEELLAGRLTPSGYASGPFIGGHAGTGTQIPPTVGLAGKRFILDGWAQSRVVYDAIRWVGDGVPDRYRFSDAVVRRFPSVLDIAYGVLANDGIAPFLAERIRRTDGVPFRDGLPYQHNLAAVRSTVDQLGPEAWTGSVYGLWLAALRSLSERCDDPRYPEAMRTRAWAFKDVNTQSASWTQLRHDTVLYAAEPYTGMILCDYPAGCVEMRPAFWKAMESLVRFTRDLLARFPVDGTITVTLPHSSLGGSPFTLTVDLKDRQEARIALCDRFAAEVVRLGELCQKQLSQTPFSSEDTVFIRSVMNDARKDYQGKTFSGWYPALFYETFVNGIAGMDKNPGSDRPDPLTVGVHTAPPDQVDPEGGVLHEAVGGVDLLLIAVDNGPDRAVYAGPTFSHYEWIEKGPRLKRLTDDEWAQRLRVNDKPPRPDWTRGHLVPR